MSGTSISSQSRKPALPRLLPIDPRFFSAFPRLEKRGKNAKSIWRLLLRQLSSSWLSFHQTANCWWLSLSLGFALGLSSLGLEQPASGGLSLTADRGSGKVLRLGLNFRVNKRQTGDGQAYARGILPIKITVICLNINSKCTQTH